MSSASSAIRNRAPIILLASIVVVLLASSRLSPLGCDLLERQAERPDSTVHQHSAPAPPQRGPENAHVGYQRGMTLGDWGPDAYEPTATRDALLGLRRRGVRSVTLFTVWMQRNERSSKIAPGPSTVRDVRLERAIGIARSLGLDVVLRPYVDMLNRAWRGDAQPRKPAQWWRDYRRFILRYAVVAQRLGVSMYVVGSEMKSQSGRSARWRALVHDVRAHFRGAVTYEANWDEFEKVDWWRAVDVIDVSGYFPLASEPGASVQQLTAAWATPRKRLRAAARRFGRPVMLGEAGFTASATAAVQPWNVEIAGPVDPGAQARAYEATFRAWAGVPWFKGFQWWFVPADRRRVGSKLAHWHIPRAQALDVLTNRYRQ
jgi:Glycoside Hydrolase Family 113